MRIEVQLVLLLNRSVDVRLTAATDSALVYAPTRLHHQLNQPQHQGHCFRHDQCVGSWVKFLQAEAKVKGRELFVLLVRGF